MFRTLQMTLLAALLAGPSVVSAQENAASELTIVVNSAAGSPTDAIARVMKDGIQQRLGIPVIVENEPGAGGATSAASFARRDPDGSAILLSGTGPFVFAPLLNSAVTYDPVKDFTPVAIAVDTPTLLAINPSVGASDPKSLIEVIQAAPDKFSYGSVGLGTPTHLAGKLVEREVKAPVAHIPYNGAPAAATALANGEISFYTGAYVALLPHVQAKRVTLLAAMGENRLGALPDLPSTAEVGYPQLAVPTWFSYFLPAGASPEVVARYEQAILETLGEAEVKDKLLTSGFNVVAGSAGDLAKRLSGDIEKWKTLLREMDVKVQ